jgi:hypothetical protein
MPGTGGAGRGGAGGRMARVADLRRNSPEPAPGTPRLRMAPGMADDLMRELAPLLAEEGIDVDNLDVPDAETLQRAMNRAMERRHLEMFSPVGARRDIASVVLRLVVRAILNGDTRLAGELLEQVEPESPDNSVATVSSCIGICLGLLDEWLSGRDAAAPAGLAQRTRLPGGHWSGERAATDILALAGKAKASGALDKLIARQGGEQVLHGSVLALAAAVGAGRPGPHPDPLTRHPPQVRIPTGRDDVTVLLTNPTLPFDDEVLVDFAGGRASRRAHPAVGHHGRVDHHGRGPWRRLDDGRVRGRLGG